MIIKQLETKYGIKGKAAVHRQAWKEAYVGLANLANVCQADF